MTEQEIWQFIYQFDPVGPELVTDPGAWIEENKQFGEAHSAYLKNITQEGVVLLSGRKPDGIGPAIVIFEA